MHVAKITFFPFILLGFFATDMEAPALIRAGLASFLSYELQRIQHVCCKIII